MSAMERALEDLVAALPEAIGAVVCDGTGEALACVTGPAPLPAEAEAQARALAPLRAPLSVSLPALWTRRVAAEAAPLVERAASACRSAGGGALHAVGLSVAGAHVEALALAEDLHLVLVLARPGRLARARRALDEARPELSAALARSGLVPPG
jgi:hypothetical protein